LREELTARFPDNPGYRADLADTLHDLATMLLRQRKAAAARPLLEEAIDHRRAASKQVTLKGNDAALRRLYEGLASALTQTGEHAEAARAAAVPPRLFPEDWECHLRAAESVVSCAAAAEKDSRLSASRIRMLREAYAAQAGKSLKAAVEACPDEPRARYAIAVAQNDLGSLLHRLARHKEAVAAFRQAISSLQANLDASGPVALSSRSMLGGALNNLALVLGDVGEHEDAAELLRQAVTHQAAALEQNPGQPRYREFLRNHYWNLAEALLRLGQYGKAAEAAAELPPLYPDGWKEHVRAARYLARCASLATEDAALEKGKRQAVSKGYGDRAVALLRQAAGKGWNGAAELTGPEWEPLRSRADFRELSGRLGKAPKGRPAP
jgi:tetratricopeptide (TPR) repeat protein